jgi:hypothetical protein
MTGETITFPVTFSFGKGTTNNHQRYPTRYLKRDLLHGNRKPKRLFVQTAFLVF